MSQAQEIDQSSSAATGLQRTEIPRHSRWGGPLIIPEKHRAKRFADDGTPGNRVCTKCGRVWVGKCPCVYYKRTTNFIDVIQNEFALKQWDRRLVAYGMSQRPDLVLAAAACKPPAEDKANLTREDKDALQAIADQAKDFAKGRAAATIGTSLHKLTEWMDSGQEMPPYIPPIYQRDLDAYREATQGIEWVEIECFRVHDEFKVGGTTDRMGWYNGRLRVFDLKTGMVWWEGLPAMQLAMYARSRKYNIATDLREDDVADVDLSIGYVIHLPEGSGNAEVIPVDLMKGYHACKVAKQVWEVRDEKNYFMDPVRAVQISGPTFADKAVRATSLEELREIWERAKAMDGLTDAVQAAIRRRVVELGGKLKGQ